MYYPSSENKGADQLRGHREADLRLCFRICRLLVFPRGGSYRLLSARTNKEFFKLVLYVHSQQSRSCWDGLLVTLARFSWSNPNSTFLSPLTHKCSSWISGRGRIAIEMSRLVGKPTICICENKDADQLRGNREADQRLCFRYSDSTIPLLLKSEISSF